jgi:hypothetical protein
MKYQHGKGKSTKAYKQFVQDFNKYLIDNLFIGNANTAKYRDRFVNVTSPIINRLI